MHLKVLSGRLARLIVIINNFSNENIPGAPNLIEYDPLIFGMIDISENKNYLTTYTNTHR